MGLMSARPTYGGWCFHVLHWPRVTCFATSCCIAGTSLERRKITIHVRWKTLPNQIQRHLLVQVFTSVLRAWPQAWPYWALGLEKRGRMGCGGWCQPGAVHWPALVTGASALVAFLQFPARSTWPWPLVVHRS